MKLGWGYVIDRLKSDMKPSYKMDQVLEEFFFPNFGGYRYLSGVAKLEGE